MGALHGMDDRQLLRRFVEHGSQDAFRALMERHLDFVYSVCRREVRDAALAEDVTQTVFLLLARKASAIPEGAVLAGWLFKAARYAAGDAMRRENRRQTGEREVIQEMIHQIGQGIGGQNDSPQDIWFAIEPLLNDGVAALDDKDREAVLLRYFERKSFKEVGRLLGTSEDTAQKRVSRATEKLRGHLRKHGVAVPVSLLAGLLAQQSVQAAPATCAPAIAQAVFKITSACIVGHAAAGAATTTAGTLKGVLIAMSAKKTMVITASVLAMGVIGGVVAAKMLHKPDIVALAFSPDGKLLLSGDDDNSVKVRDARTGKLLRTLGPGRYTLPSYNAPAFALSPDGKMIVTEGRDGESAELWEVATGRFIRRLHSTGHAFGNYSFSPDGRTIMSGNRGTTIWDIATDSEKLEIAAEVPDGQLAAPTVLSPDGTILAMANYELLSLWDVRTGKLLRRLPADKGRAPAIAFSPDGELAVGRNNGNVQFWDVRTGGLKREFSLGNAVHRVVFSPDGSLLASMSWTWNADHRTGYGTVKVSDAHSGQLMHQVVHHNLSSIAFSPDNKTLATGDKNNTVKLWDMTSGKERSWPE